MTKGQIRLPNGRVLATVEVEPAGNGLLGRLIHLEDTVEAALFTEYEHAVLSQLLVEDSSAAKSQTRRFLADGSRCAESG